MQLISYKADIKRLKAELSNYQKESILLDEKGSSILKMNKENADLKIKVKKAL